MIQIEQILNECQFQTARSGGKGGQHVNKVESKVLLIWNFMQSEVISTEQKTKLSEINHVYVQKEFIRISSETSRSQQSNKKNCIQKLNTFLLEAFKKQKKRITTKTPNSVLMKRKADKIHRSKLKKLRREKHIHKR